MKVILEHFSPHTPLPPPWKTFITGDGALQAAGNTLRFVNTNTSAKRYTDAQIDDYQGLKRRNFHWQPPLQMTVRARFSHPAGELSGTAGFGFWNDPFMMTGLRRPALPRAIWFFYSSPPSNIKLDLHTPGPGWKATTLDAVRWPFFLLLPTAPLAVPLMNIHSVYHTFWPIGQRAINVSEALLTGQMTEWHTYQIDWQKKTARFSVDGETLLDCQTAPRGPLGFVMWLDNQYMEVTPWGRFKYGLLDAPGQQWLEVEKLEIANQRAGGRKQGRR
ncbi:MAG: family 16 glycosylhydrolase [Anaerolineae bacterium]|nr:family 16 glycosylhydrolase [Anaerolineae bacterium]